VGQPAAPLPILPLLAVETDRAQLRAKPNLAVGASGDTGKVVPGQPIFAFVEFPTASRAATHTGFRGEPKLPFVIESHTQTVGHRPRPATVVQDRDPFPAACALAE